MLPDLVGGALVDGREHSGFSTRSFSAVRELENFIERAITLAAYDEITVDDLPAKIKDQKVSAELPATDDPIKLPTMQAVEDRYIQRVLQGAGGNKTLAAKILGFDRRTLYRKLATLSTNPGKAPENCRSSTISP